VFKSVKMPFEILIVSVDFSKLHSSEGILFVQYVNFSFFQRSNLYHFIIIARTGAVCIVFAK